LALNC